MKGKQQSRNCFCPVSKLIHAVTGREPSLSRVLLSCSSASPRRHQLRRCLLSPPTLRLRRQTSSETDFISSRQPSIAPWTHLLSLPSISIAVALSEKKKVTSSPTQATAIIADIDIYKFNPWDLPGKAFFGEGEWFFFSPRDRKYPNGSRPNRAAGCGYWKATGTDKPILEIGGSHFLGVKKALVFYKGKPPKGFKTDWVMHEYRILDNNEKHKGSMRLDDWVLCRVRQKGTIPSEANTNYEIVSSSDCLNEKQENPRERLSCTEVVSHVEKSTGATSEENINQTSDMSQSFSLKLDSIKRMLSFEALDELMLQPPSKRHCYDTCYSELVSPNCSFSIDYGSSYEFLF